MACRDGTSILQVMLHFQPWQFWPMMGPENLVAFWHVFMIFWGSNRANSKPARPDLVKTMRIQILKGRGPGKFCVKSSGGTKVQAMVMKFQNFHDFAIEINFRRVLRPQNPVGSCAARNVQNFGFHVACRDG